MRLNGWIDVNREGSNMFLFLCFSLWNVNNFELLKYLSGCHLVSRLFHTFLFILLIWLHFSCSLGLAHWFHMLEWSSTIASMRKILLQRYVFCNQICKVKIMHFITSNKLSELNQAFLSAVININMVDSLLTFRNTRIARWRPEICKRMDASRLVNYDRDYIFF